MTQPLFSLSTREVELEDRPPALVVAVSGEVDITNAAAFKQSLTETAASSPVVADLSGLDYIDSAGFAVLDWMLARGAITIVLDAASPIRAAADLVNLPCHDSLAEAVAATA